MLQYERPASLLNEEGGTKIPNYHSSSTSSPTPKPPSSPALADANGNGLNKQSMSTLSEVNLAPSSPNSFKDVNNDIISNETSPSSHIEERNTNSTVTISKPNNAFQVYEIDPLQKPDQESGNIGEGNFKGSGGVEESSDTIPVVAPSDSDAQGGSNRVSPGITQSEKFRYDQFNLLSHRRHTTNDISTFKSHDSRISGNKIPQNLQKSSIDEHSISSIQPNPSNASIKNELPPHRSTFPNTKSMKLKSKSSFDLLKNPTNDSTNSEFQRMRNSVIVKRNMKKRKKEFLDDDKVLIGNKISEGHENFVMAYNMLTGIRVAVSRCSGVMKKLNDQDFKNYKKLTFNIDGSELTPSSKYDFKFKDYCPEVFRELRTLFGLDPADYLISITGKYILSELTSPGKSGSFFYYSRDFRYIIKTVHHSEHRQLRKILKNYYTHIKNNPNTLVSQIYGLHRVKMPLGNGGKRKVHFIVMNNLFPPHRDIHTKYDLKGSTWGRYTRNNENKNKPLKDLNWLENHCSIKFGPDKQKMFFKQLESDVNFLKSVNVMDYSLLLGIHDVRNKSTSTHNKLTIFDPKSNDKKELIKTNPRDVNENDLPTDVFPGRTKLVFYGHDGGIRSTNELNEPLSEIYYLGVIDFLTNYSFRKRLETFWRSLSHNRSTISALPAHEYGDRFLQFIKNSTTRLKQKKS